MIKLDPQFKHDIIKILLDKLLIGVILVFIGIFANNMVEHYKSEEGFRTELNKTRVASIGEVWEKLYTYEASVDNLVYRFTTIAIEAQSDEEELERRQEELPALNDIAVESLSQLHAALNKNRFWIGEETYSEITNYVDVLLELQSAYWNYDVERIEECNEQREELRRGVTSIRDMLLGE